MNRCFVGDPTDEDRFPLASASCAVSARQTAFSGFAGASCRESTHTCRLLTAQTPPEPRLAALLCTRQSNLLFLYANTLAYRLALLASSPLQRRTSPQCRRGLWSHTCADPAWTAHHCAKIRQRRRRHHVAALHVPQCPLGLWAGRC
jgi:hypothetical protein